jgi:GT2 family glycosyltransferase
MTEDGALTMSNEMAGKSRVKSIANVAISLVNWKNSADTILCIESLLGMNTLPALIVICDNNSNDRSCEDFRRWCSIRESKTVEIADPAIYSVVFDGKDLRKCDEIRDVLWNSNFPAVVFIENPMNDGFAAGCNTGLRLARKLFSPDWVWFLNNDTVVDEFALSELLKKSVVSSEDCGVIGARIMYYDDPSRLQYAGGATSNAWLATVKPLDDESLSEEQVEAEMSYVVGASMFVSSKYLDEVGEMDEEYFLYYEEQDWAARSSRMFSFAYASKAVIYHREGASIGGKTSDASSKSRTAEFYATRSRVLFTLRHKWWFLPTVTLAILGGITRRVVNRRFANALYVFQGFLGGLKSGFVRRGA